MKEVRDQAAHLCAAALILLPALISPWLACVSGFGIGLVRELTEEGEITLSALKHIFTGPILTGSRLDLIFWTLGGLIAGLA